LNPANQRADIINSLRYFFTVNNQSFWQ